MVVHGLAAASDGATLALLQNDRLQSAVPIGRVMFRPQALIGLPLFLGELAQQARSLDAALLVVAVLSRIGPLTSNRKASIALSLASESFGPVSLAEPKPIFLTLPLPGRVSSTTADDIQGPPIPIKSLFYTALVDVAANTGDGG
jgi:hypothetical protein